MHSLPGINSLPLLKIANIGTYGPPLAEGAIASEPTGRASYDSDYAYEPGGRGTGGTA
jgi:hypothetical protein